MKLALIKKATLIKKANHRSRLNHRSRQRITGIIIVKKQIAELEKKIAKLQQQSPRLKQQIEEHKKEVVVSLLKCIQILNISLRDLVLARLEDVRFTPREKHVVWYLLNGFSDKNIGTALEISVETIRDHMRHIRGKTGVTSRLQLIARMLKL